ncbi:hypothetical protein FQA47_016167 [Oryzias melastigma]|uniref:Uncharacterized protein n=1 Tax=Oryzias melastigma TaxID=30732 RepID=A0A834L3A7_ORYME|nr:hypothetical protein FQA47_016167 [Oryzias melastigma]
MLDSQGSPIHLNSPGPHSYHPIYANSSSSSSPVSHPSTPSGAAESPFAQSYSPSPTQVAASSTQAGGSPASLLPEDASPISAAITVKQEPQELDQMYLDDGGMQRGKRQGLCFPVLSPRSRHLTAVVIRGVCRSLISLWQ